jgi:hypothetical protein
VRSSSFGTGGISFGLGALELPDDFVILLGSALDSSAYFEGFKSAFILSRLAIAFDFF